MGDMAWSLINLISTCPMQRLLCCWHSAGLCLCMRGVMCSSPATWESTISRSVKSPGSTIRVRTSTTPPSTISCEHLHGPIWLWGTRMRLETAASTGCTTSNAVGGTEINVTLVVKSKKSLCLSSDHFTTQFDILGNALTHYLLSSRKLDQRIETTC